jgi:hypothetical protein
MNKHLCSLITGLLLSFAINVSAQTLQGRLMDMQFSIEEPVTDQWYKLPNMVTVKMKATNLGPDTACAGDTVVYGFNVGAYARRLLIFNLNKTILPKDFVFITDTIAFHDRPSPPWGQSSGKMILQLYGCFMLNRNKTGPCGFINQGYDANMGRGLNNMDTVWISYTNAQSNTTTTYLPANAVYPNPFQDKIQVGYGQPLQQINISDAAGRVVFTQKMDGEKQATLDVSSLKPGVYFMEITETGGGQKVNKIIKQHE